MRMTEKKEKRGRPKLPDSERRVPFTIRMTPGAIEEIEAHAKAAGQDASTWAREQLRRACESGK